MQISLCAQERITDSTIQWRAISIAEREDTVRQLRIIPNSLTMTTSAPGPAERWSGKKWR